jgi:hypothetical protein
LDDVIKGHGMTDLESNIFHGWQDLNYMIDEKVIEEAVKPFLKRNIDDEVLYDADPNCKHEIEPQLSGGIKCKKCGGWFCY